MSAQAGRGGMGSHKHATSGRCGPSPRFKLGRALDDNRERQEKRRKSKPMTDSSVRSAVEGFKPM
jgi:hypothetical protein